MAFVQNITTREIYQAALFSPSILTSVPNNSEDSNGILAFPNPAKTSFKILTTTISEEGSLCLVNSLGQVVWSHQGFDGNANLEIDV